MAAAVTAQFFAADKVLYYYYVQPLEELSDIVQVLPGTRVGVFVR